MTSTPASSVVGSSRLNVKRVCILAATALLLGLVVVAIPRARPAAAVTTGWTTYHHDNTRTGYDASAPAYVGGPYGSWTKAVDRAIYAEPLAYNGFVYAATMGDSVYAFDAATGNQAWARVGLGAADTSAHCSFNPGSIGITSTPVIDPGSNILYAVGLTTAPTAKYTMYGLNLADGSNAAGFPVDLSIDPAIQNQRAALALAGGHVYVAFGGWLGDCFSYHPIVVSVPVAGGAQDHVYDGHTNACQSGAGIWGPSGIAVDASGNLYVATGNGKTCYGSTTFPCTNASWDHGDGVIKLSGALAELDYWAPDNATMAWCALHAGDTDIGSIGPALLPNNTVFQTGKPGYGWLLNATSFGTHFDTQQFQGQIDGCTPEAIFGGLAYYAGRIYVPCENGIGLVAFGVDTVNHTFNSTADWIQAVSPGPPIAAMGLIWARDTGGNNLYGFDPAAGTQLVKVALGGGYNRFGSLAEDGGRIFVPHGAAISGFDFNPPTCNSSTSAHWFASCSSQQYRLTGSSASSWADMDPSNLQISFTPGVASVAVISANSSLWTSTAGYNQDLGIAVSGGGYPTTTGRPEAWKESGGSTTYAPNAAFLQTVIPVAASTTYTARIQWKANQNDPYTIWAGAGPLGSRFSPTRITAWLIPASPTTEWARSSTLQYSILSSNAAGWQDIDPTNLSVTFTPPAGAWLAFVSGNADLWTSGAGANQDLGIAMSGGAYPTNSGQPEAWKESGGPAVMSPNAAFVQAPLPVAGGTTYTARLQWKANHSAAGSIWSGAGNGSYSPTSIAVILVPSPAGGSAASSTKQYPFPNAGGSTWQALDAATLKLTLAPGASASYLLSGNVDLWSDTAGYGQDVGVMISGGSFGAGTLLSWQESGATGTFSPNAAFVFGDVALTGGSYTVWLVWKANHAAPGVTIYAGAGPIGTKYSPTWLTATALN